MSPYNASASAKMRIRIIPTNSLGCCALALQQTTTPNHQDHLIKSSGKQQTFSTPVKILVHYITQAHTTTRLYMVISVTYLFAKGYTKLPADQEMSCLMIVTMTLFLNMRNILQ